MLKLHPFLMLTVTCVACGASFSANDASSGGSGVVGTAGDASGGLASSAGSPDLGDAGQAEVGGSSSAGQTSTAGAGGSISGAGGSVSSAGRGGWGSGGWKSGGAGGVSGVGGAVDQCAALAQKYQAAVDRARVCDKGSTDECSPSSVAQPIGGCGCPVFINAKSDYATAVKNSYQAYQDAKCDAGVAVCDIACASPTSVSCAQQSMGSGNTFVCTPSLGIPVPN